MWVLQISLHYIVYRLFYAVGFQLHTTYQLSKNKNNVKYYLNISVSNVYVGNWYFNESTF